MVSHLKNCIEILNTKEKISNQGKKCNFRTHSRAYEYILKWTQMLVFHLGFYLIPSFRVDDFGKR